MEPEDLETFRSQYQRMTDYDIADLHARGPAALVDPELWVLVDGEFRRRGQRVADQAIEIKRGITNEVHRAQAREQLAAVYAPWWARVAATLIDLAILVAIVTLMGLLLPTRVSDARTLLFLITYYAYHVSLESTTGATLGKRLLRLRVVTPEGTKPSALRLLARATMRFGALFGLLWYLVWQTPWGHDVLSRTRVVRHVNVSSDR